MLVFAANHGVVARGVSPYPAAVTAQMVANFAAGGAAINQLAGVAGATLRVLPLELDRPTADFTAAPAMTEAEFAQAFAAGQDAVRPEMDLLCLGEMGIGNTTAGAALAAALFGAALGHAEAQAMLAPAGRGLAGRRQPAAAEFGQAGIGQARCPFRRPMHADVVPRDRNRAAQTVERQALGERIGGLRLAIDQHVFAIRPQDEVEQRLALRAEQRRP